MVVEAKKLHFIGRSVLVFLVKIPNSSIAYRKQILEYRSVDLQYSALN